MILGIYSRNGTSATYPSGVTVHSVTLDSGSPTPELKALAELAMIIRKSLLTTKSVHDVMCVVNADVFDPASIVHLARCTDIKENMLWIDHNNTNIEYFGEHTKYANTGYFYGKPHTVMLAASCYYYANQMQSYYEGLIASDHNLDHTMFGSHIKNLGIHATGIPK